MIAGRIRMAICEASTDRPGDPDGNVRLIESSEVDRLGPLLAQGVDARARLGRGDLCVVLEDAGEIRGLVWWARSGHPDPHMGRHSRASEAVALGNQFAVDPSFRSRGYGQAILRGSLDILRDHGIDRARLLIGLRNEPSRRSARSAGFVESAHLYGLRAGGRSLTVPVPRRPAGGTDAEGRARRKHSAQHYARRIVGEVTDHPSNRARPRRAVARAVGWQVWKRVLRRPLDVDMHGLVVRCHPDSQSASNIWYFTPRYDHHEMLFLERYLRPGDHVLDVGANIGTYTILAAALTAPDGQVIAFEPDPVNASRLRENVAINSLEHRVTVHEAATTSTDGPVWFLSDHDVSNAIQQPGHRPGGAREVRGVRIDSLVTTDPGPALAKVDVEGAEYDALRGTEALLAAGLPPVLLVEVLSHQLNHFGTTWDELRDLLGDHGYQPWTYDADRQLLAPVTGVPSGNCLFVAEREIDQVRDRLSGPGADAAPPPLRLRGRAGQRPSKTPRT